MVKDQDYYIPILIPRFWMKLHTKFGYHNLNVFQDILWIDKNAFWWMDWQEYGPRDLIFYKILKVT